MTPEVKKRIAQIRRGEVPEGYQKTKVGIVSYDWGITDIGHCVKEYREISNDIANIPIYSSSRKGLMPQSDYYDGKEAVETNIGYKVVPEGYVTYRHMSDDDIFHFNINHSGRSVLVSSEYPVFYESDNSSLGYIVPVLNNTARFRYYCRTQKLGGTRTRLYFKNLCAYTLAVPSLAEQQKIAEILTTQDRVIELKERLIAEKQRQKKYLMENIFACASNYKYLREFSIITMGQSPASSSYNINGIGLPLVQGNADIQHRAICPRMYTSAPTKKCKIDDILISVRAPVGSVARSNRVACIGRGVCTIDAGKYQDYLYQFLLYYEDKWGKVSQGSTFGSISGDDIKKLNVPIVDNIDQVVNLLSTADREIELLQQELEQEKQKKKALMQLLLTGIVRVNI